MMTPTCNVPAQVRHVLNVRPKLNHYVIQVGSSQVYTPNCTFFVYFAILARANYTRVGVLNFVPRAIPRNCIKKYYSSTGSDRKRSHVKENAVDSPSKVKVSKLRHIFRKVKLGRLITWVKKKARNKWHWRYHLFCRLKCTYLLHSLVAGCLYFCYYKQ